MIRFVPFRHSGSLLRRAAIGDGVAGFYIAVGIVGEVGVGWRDLWSTCDSDAQLIEEVLLESESWTSQLEDLAHGRCKDRQLMLFRARTRSIWRTRERQSRS